MSGRLGPIRYISAAPWHPLLFVAAIQLSFWLDTLVSPYAAARALLIGLAGTAILLAALWVALRDRHVAGAAVSALILVLYAKHFVRLVDRIAPAMGPVVLVLWILLVVAAAVLAIRALARYLRRWNGPRATTVLNRVGIVLVLATLVSGVFGGKLQHAFADLRQGIDLNAAATSDPTASRGVANGHDPDIYVLLLDGYPRADVLEHAFEFDNSGFLGELEQRGFEIATASHSDYLWTHVTLPSLLDMRYVEQIDGLQAIIRGEAPLHPTLRDVVNSSTAFRFAEERGYSTVAVGAGFEQLSLRQADIYIDSGQLNEYELKLMLSTFLGDVVSVIAPDFASGQHRDRVTDSLEAVGAVAAAGLGSPRLVFAHIPSPHQPTVFGPNGEPRTEPLGVHFYSDSPIERGEPVDEFLDAYRGQLEHLNRITLAAVDRIHDAAESPPVIILLADHGSASRVDWLVTEPKDAEPADLLERTGILFAAVTPNRDEVFPEDISPTNVFRYLFDAYFGTAFGPANPPPDGGQIPPVDASAWETD